MAKKETVESFEDAQVFVVQNTFQTMIRKALEPYNVKVKVEGYVKAVLLGKKYGSRIVGDAKLDASGKKLGTPDGYTVEAFGATPEDVDKAMQQACGKAIVRIFGVNESTGATKTGVGKPRTKGPIPQSVVDRIKTIRAEMAWPENFDSACETLIRAQLSGNRGAGLTGIRLTFENVPGHGILRIGQKDENTKTWIQAVMTKWREAVGTAKLESLEQVSLQKQIEDARAKKAQEAEYAAKQAERQAEYDVEIARLQEKLAVASKLTETAAERVEQHEEREAMAG